MGTIISYSVVTFLQQGPSVGVYAAKPMFGTQRPGCAGLRYCLGNPHSSPPRGGVQSLKKRNAYIGFYRVIYIYIHIYIY